MKKFLLSMAAVAAFGFANAAEVTVNFQDPESIGVTKAANGEATVATGFEYQNIKGTITQGQDLGSGQEFRFFTSSAGVVDFRCSAKGGAKGHTLVVTTTNGQTITGISFTGTNFGFTAAPGALEVNTSAKTATWTGGATEVTFTTTGAVNLYTMTVTTEAGGGEVKKDAALAFSAKEFTIDFGDEFTAPELTKETTAEVEYESSDDNVASVNELTGEVTIEGIGTATITARTAETTDYYAGVASYTINVLDPSVILSATFGSSNDGFTFEDGELDGLTYVWTRATSYGYMKASGYYQGAHAVEGAYLVSPVLDLTGRKNITADYRQCVGQLNGINPADALSFAIREEGGAWTKVAITSFPEITSGNFSSFEDAPTVDLSAYAGKKIQLGWCYTSTASAACTWEIDNVVVKGDKDSSAIATVEVENENAPVEYFNLQGVRVANPENGFYIRRQGNKVEKVVIR